MISHLRGEVTQTGEGFLVLDVGGVGYRVFMPVPDLHDLSEGEGQVTVFTHLAVREDALTLYGFARPGSLEMFRLLISVNRVGPALALTILSGIPVPDFAAAILDEDENVLTRIPGIGQKSAKRLIVELKDKLKKKALLVMADERHGDPVRDDAVAALVSLGFQRKESVAAVENVIKSQGKSNVESVIKAALMTFRSAEKEA
jgi:Holliday junction DNA helicase RuvA